jgi:hypothetical protein
MKSQGNKPLVRLWSKCDDNIKIDFKEMVYEDVDWIQLIQDKICW